MVVDHFNTSVGGGAGIAAGRLHASLCHLGVTSRFHHLKTASRFSKDESYHVAHWTVGTQPMRRAAAQLVAACRKPLQKRTLRRALRGRSVDCELFTDPRRTARTPCAPEFLGSDLFHLHWVANLIDYPSFFLSLPDEFPIVWTLHDVNPFTGGCHYTRSCNAFTTGCHSCPQLGTPSLSDWSHRFYEIKSNAVCGKNLHVVAPSHWMEREASRSRMFETAKSFQTIHNGVDTDLFMPCDKATAKRRLRLPTELPVVAFGAESLASRRKGFDQLLQALPLIASGQSFTAIAFGEQHDVPQELASFEIRMLGFVKNEAELAKIYAAADVFVLPSLEENLAQTGIEALACGTPVVAFETGGNSDFVKSYQTGLSARIGDPSDLARQITWLLDHPDQMRRMGEQARRFAEREFNSNSQAEKYLAFYRSIVKDDVYDE